MLNNIERDSLEGKWPTPIKVSNIGIFNNISNVNNFNKIISNPKNWQAILERYDLYHYWIKPNAILIFGKLWFERVKWKKSIHKMAPFPLFSDDEKLNAKKNNIPLENTNIGKSKISRISLRVEYALEKYLLGGGKTKSGKVKSPGGYITNSIKNEFIKEIGKDAGYKLTKVNICPLCASSIDFKNKIISPLKEIKKDIYFCEKCNAKYNNLKLISNDNHIQRLFISLEKVTCVCPSVNCPGKFVPIRSIEDEAWWETDKGILADKAIKSLKKVKGINNFKNPPEELLDISLVCPYCNIRFSPRNVLDDMSGFKKQSGKLTGFPSSYIWKKKEECIIDASNNSLMANKYKDPLESIINIEQMSVLINELFFLISNLKDTKNGIISKCFYLAVIKWIKKYPFDASRYFFNYNNKNRIIKGNDASIHQKFFSFWMHYLSLEIKNGNLSSFLDLKWLCHPPKYNSAKMKFNIELKKNLHISLANILDKQRIAWILSIKKDDENFAKYIINKDWNSFCLDQRSKLNKGDIVNLTILTMPDHHCHAPLKRISRLRKNLKPLIDKIKEEEETGNIDLEFWNKRKKRGKYARATTMASYSKCN